MPDHTEAAWLRRLLAWLEPFEDGFGRASQRGASQRYVAGLPRPTARAVHIGLQLVDAMDPGPRLLPTLRSALTRVPGLKWTYQALRAGYGRASDALHRHRPRDPASPWQSAPFLDTAEHANLLRVGDRYRPLTLQCETVNTCNNLCVICAYPVESRARVVMSMSLFEKVLTDYSEMGGGQMTLTPVTGDVLLDRHLLARLDLARRFPRIREISVTTNAVMLDRFSDDEVAALAAGLGRIQISIYGLDEDEYTAMTKRRTYGRAVEGINRLLAARARDVFLSFRLLRPRSRHDIDNWIARTLQPTGPVQIKSIMTGGYANFVNLDTSRPLPLGATWAPEPPRRSQCLIPLLAVQVSSNGDVFFCSCVTGFEDLRLGNIEHDTLLELYNAPKARALWHWAKHGVPPSCARCTFYTPLDRVRADPSILREPFTLLGA